MKPKLFPLSPVLIVDDEEHILKNLKVVLKSADIRNVITCNNSSKVKYFLNKQDFSVILLDLFMPKISGETLLPMIRSDFPDIPIIVVTGINEINRVVNCIKLGAYDYLVKPIENNYLISVVRHAIELKELKNENYMLKNSILKHEVKDPTLFLEIITQNKAMQSIFEYIETISLSREPIIITGETGTGKELIANAIHKASGCEGEFVAVNIAGLDENTFSDTLFGHTRGAFTGAEKSRDGLIKQAENGTLFLDEIGDLPSSSQIKILRVIQEHSYMPLGSDFTIRSSARIIVATNLDLNSMKEKGTFRKDLYYRLKTHLIHVPPLRDRLDDLPLLVDHFIDRSAKTLNKKKPAIPKELISLFSVYHFPGNIRELETIIFDTVSKHKSKIMSLKMFDHILNTENKIKLEQNEKVSELKQSFSFPEVFPTIKKMERMLISEAMRRSNNNKVLASKLLGITRQGLSKYLKKSLTKV